MFRIFNFSNWKTRTKISSLVLLAAFLTIASLLAFNLYVSVQRAYSDRGTEMIHFSQLAFEQAAAIINGSTKSLQTLAISPSLIAAVEEANKAYDGRSQADLNSEIAVWDKAWKDEDPSIEARVAEIQASQTSVLLQKFASVLPEEVEVFVTDIQGLNVGMTDRTGDYLQADEGWWKSAYANGTGSLFVSEVGYDESSGIWAIDVGVPVRSADQKVIGILRGTIDVSVIFETFASISFGTTGSAAILDSQGTVLYYKNSDLSMQPAPAEFAAVAASQKEGWQTGLNLNNKPAILAHSSLGGNLGDSLGWRMVISQDTSELNGDILKNNLQVIWITLFLLVFLLGIAFYVSDYISKPISQAAAIIEDLANGNMQGYSAQRVKSDLVNRQDEAGLLWRSIGELHSYLLELTGYAERIATGDLTVEVKTRSSQDTLSIAFAEMITDLKNQINQVAQGARQLEQESAEMSASAHEANTSVGEIVDVVRKVAVGVKVQGASINQTSASVTQLIRAIDGLAKGASEQAQAVSRASALTNEMTNGIQQVAGNALEVTKDSASAAEAARAGVQVVQQTVQGMDSIKAKVGLSAQRVQDMGSRSSQIGLIVETIEDIASQTNLLALNAAIEAARAGEHGKGFAVVADEVRRLAERSSSATKEIAGLIKGIQTTVTEAVAAMDAGAREVENGVALANKAGEALVQITRAAEAVQTQSEQASAASERMKSASRQLVEAMDSVSAVVEQNTAATEEMAASSNEVTQSIDHIASVSQESAASIETVANSAQTMSGQVEAVNSSAAALSDLANSLHLVVTQFKLEEEGRQAQKPAARQPQKQGVR